MFKQIGDFFSKNFFSKFHSGFRKSYRTQQYLITVLKNGYLLLINKNAFEHY